MRRYCFAAFTVCVFQFAPEWLAPEVASLVDTLVFQLLDKATSGKA